jgi:hypothetical protein
MSEVTIRCLKCGKVHGIEKYNARLLGPVLYVECPFCRKKTICNLSKFVEKQVRAPERLGRYALFNVMLCRAKEIQKRLL